MTQVNNGGASPVDHDENAALFLWIGYADIHSAINQLKQSEKIPPGKADALLEKIEETRKEYEEEGKLKRLIDSFSFGEIHVLSDKSEELTDLYKQWIKLEGYPITSYRVDVEDPHDYEEIYKETKKVLEDFSQRDGNEAKKLAYFINPGTTAMGMTWTLLSKSAYPGILYQLSGKQTQPRIVDLPFEINLDFLPEIEARKNAGLLIDHDLTDLDSLVGNSQACHDMKTHIARYSKTPYPILLEGQNGSGKGLAARAIHKASGRAPNGPNKIFENFVHVNCAAIASNLIESELFGHFKGSFTGAIKDKKGKFHQADTGTLFLDEIGELSLDLQSKLLTVLEPEDNSKPTVLKVQPVGSDEENSAHSLHKPIDVRIIFATNRNLGEMVNAGEFRLDLYYRIAALCIRVPSLNERVDDIPRLSKDFLDRQNKAMTEQVGNILPAKTLTAGAINTLCEQEWRGNIRQLNSVITRAYVNTDLREEIDSEDIERSLEQDLLANPRDSVFGKSLPLEEGQLENLENRAKAEVSYHYWKRALEKVEKPRKNLKAAEELKFHSTNDNTIRDAIKDACKGAGKPPLVGRDA